MVKYYEIEEADLARLIGGLKYVIDRKGHVIDDAMVEFLESELTEVENHHENERTGGGDGTTTEIDAVLNFIQRGYDGRKKST